MTRYSNPKNGNIEERIMNILMRIRRYNPEKDNKPYWDEFRVDMEPIDRLLDALNVVKWTMDGTLTYRRSCAHGVCGSDAMRINGRNRLACKVLIRDVGAAARHAILWQRDGVWGCRTIFNCAGACPRGSHVTDLIEQVKRAIVYDDTKGE